MNFGYVIDGMGGTFNLTEYISITEFVGDEG
jgi:hypothetical protein